MIYCGLNCNTFKLLLIDHIVILDLNTRNIVFLFYFETQLAEFWKKQVYTLLLNYVILSYHLGNNHKGGQAVRGGVFQFCDRLDTRGEGV